MSNAFNNFIKKTFSYYESNFNKNFHKTLGILK